MIKLNQNIKLFILFKTNAAYLKYPNRHKLKTIPKIKYKIFLKILV